MNTALNKKFFSYVIPSILAFALSGVYTCLLYTSDAADEL